MKFKLWKVKVAILSNFNFFFDSLYSILILLILRFKKNQLKIKKNQKVLIVGSGASIDGLRFDKIKNCSIILLNNSWQLFDKFNKEKNEIYFLCASSGVLNSISHELPSYINKIFICDLLNLNFRSLLITFKTNTNLYLPDFYKYNHYEKKKIFNCKDLKLSFGYFKFAFQKLDRAFFTENKIYPLPYTSLYSAIAFFTKLNSNQIISIGIDNNNHHILEYSKHINLSSYKKRYGNKKIHFDYKKRLIKNSLWNIKIHNELRKLNITWYDLNYVAETKHPNRINLNEFKRILCC